ncbi:hypothetical protein LC653_34940 [Nostoc sp. CHAB 5784]|uniref:hypothetical protein n=1 Tax=Nostoc mirabile TaxID=2907820 RepID=UPI001E32AC7E|nr:hypothetical protein [Nostoc mirabile]MCC5668916.1 hypothetical protein [Nostoc mirabile CHAB5784]
MERAHESSRLVGTFGQAFDIIFDIDILIVKGLAQSYNLLSINCVQILKIVTFRHNLRRRRSLPAGGYAIALAI